MDRWIRWSAGSPAQDLELFCGDRLLAAALFFAAAAAFLYAAYGPRWALSSALGLAALSCGLALCYAAGRVGSLGTVLTLSGLAWWPGWPVLRALACRGSGGGWALVRAGTPAWDSPGG